MTIPEISAYASAAVLVIGALGTFVTTVIAALHRIETKVDGAATSSANKIDSLQEKIVTLHGVIADKKETVAVLAQTVAATRNVRAEDKK